MTVDWFELGGIARQVTRVLLVVTAAICATQAGAARLLSVSPEGEAPRLRQVVLRFSDAMVAFGDPRAPAPADLRCEGAPAVTMTGRWQNDRTWSFDFARELPAGVSCTVVWRDGLADQAGKPLDKPRVARVYTGGPSVIRQEPWGGEIEEVQHFRLLLDGPVAFETIERHGYCEAAGIHERIPLRIVERDPDWGGPRRARGDAESVAPGHSVLVRCQRPLPAGAAASVVWAKGIATVSGAARGTDQRLRYQVREAFTANVSCERQRAQAPCSPLSAITVGFSAPVPVEVLRRAVLRGAGRDVSPRLEDEGAANALRFDAPLIERERFTLILPPDLKDESGRALANGALFPMTVNTAQWPPLIKFAAAPFGILELNDDPVLPITLRNVEADLGIAVATPARPVASSVHVTSDAKVIEWMRRLTRHHDRREAVRESTPGARPVQGRGFSLLREAGVAPQDIRRITLPPVMGHRGPIEVIGLPLREPGLHVVEVESTLLGRVLLDRDAPMFVRTGVLVTNLAVHLKLGRENAAVWVTTLDRGRPMRDAQVRISDCQGKEIWRGRTDARGLALAEVALAPSLAICDGDEIGLLVSARARDAQGREDYAFALSSWTEGIEGWRFSVATALDEPAPTLRAHTVMDRTLVRAGETVSMKHFVRRESASGLAPVASDTLPTRAIVTHRGSDQRFELPLRWVGSRYATSEFRVPAQARSGHYDVRLAGQDEGGALDAGGLRVEAFRLPVFEGGVNMPTAAQVAVTEVPVDVRLNFLSGGPAADLPVRVSALLRKRSIQFEAWEGFHFDLREGTGEGGDPVGEMSEADGRGSVVADSLALTLDAQGQARTTIRALEIAGAPRELLVEARFRDPNGETQTVSSTATLYPAAVLVGMRVADWVSARDKVSVRTVVVDAAGQPSAGAPVEIEASMVKRISTRKRLVGGLYGYDHRIERQSLGVVCAGRSDARGGFGCEVPAARAGEMLLVARARDAAGRVAAADATAWVSGQGEAWFDAGNQDRIDVLPERRRYEPGQQARFQVRMPFRRAIALVAIEREGVIDTRVVELSGRDPSFTLPIDAAWGPNVFVSVLAVRGRVREVPWHALFTWGWRAPLDWWRDRQASGEHRAPTATVDLSRPAFKFGVAEIQVGLEARELKVTVTPERERYEVRERARATIRVTDSQGRPAPGGTEVALAAVDQALLELQPNRSWQVLEAMYRRRGWGVQTATAQMQVVGKRHYGRKAVAPGGGGGRAPTRELFDTLLLWQAALPLDASGEARVDIPLNDSLTTFRVTAIADSPDGRFGHGSGTLRVSRDLQVIGGLPPLVRDGDDFTAMVTLRNTTQRAMTIAFDARSASGDHRRTVELAAGASRELDWPVQVRLGDGARPAGAGGADPLGAGDRPRELAWELNARDTRSGAQDHARLVQRVIDAVPLGVHHADIRWLRSSVTIPVAPPSGAQAARGGVSVTVQRRLSDGLPGVRRYFERYPFSCLEQRASRAIGLRDVDAWRKVVEDLPTYLDDQGFAAYFPISPDARSPGSDTLTAYLLSVTDEAARLDARYALPAAVRERMERALIGFVEGRIKRDAWAPFNDLSVRKLAALEALSRTGKVTAPLTESVDVDLAAWPSGALLDWYAVLTRAPSLPRRDERVAAADQAIRARLSYQGTRLGWTTEEADHWWWLMSNGDVNGAKLLSAVLDLPGWREDVPRIAIGLLARLRQGHWRTTNANLLGSLALERFSRRFERDPVSGQSAMVMREMSGETRSRAVGWSDAVSAATMSLAWPVAGPAATLALAHVGSGAPWASVSALAAVPLTAPMAAGFAIEKSVTPVRTGAAGVARGDVLRVKLRITPGAASTWVVVDDPIPAGATVLASGMGRDSAIDARVADPRTVADGPRPTFDERTFDAYRAYYAFVDARPFDLEYTIRVNNPGRFLLPPTRVEAMYRPEMFGAWPNAPMVVVP